MSQPDFLTGSLDTLITIASHRVEIDPVHITAVVDDLAEQEECSADEIAYTMLYHQGLTSKEEE